DPMVVKHHGGDLRKANIHPAARERLLAQYPVPAEAAVAADESNNAGSTATEATRHQCPNCTYVYDDAVGCAHEGFAPGTKFSMLPHDWQCPACAVREKPDFVAVLPG
ncbi:MAG TPA: rubredoxin, partial [Nevskiaceae bacterium]|nr:rubredoxin [Nevskiaceae bacterium]